MPPTLPPVLDTPWTLWKRHWSDHVTTAGFAACLETGAFCLFLFLFTQDAVRLFAVTGAALLIFLTFHIGISALNAYILSRPKVAAAIATAPPG